MRFTRVENTTRQQIQICTAHYTYIVQWLGMARDKSLLNETQDSLSRIVSMNHMDALIIVFLNN